MRLNVSGFLIGKTVEAIFIDGFNPADYDSSCLGCGGETRKRPKPSPNQEAVPAQPPVAFTR